MIKSEKKEQKRRRRRSRRKKRDNENAEHEAKMGQEGRPDTREEKRIEKANKVPSPYAVI